VVKAAAARTPNSAPFTRSKKTCRGRQPNYTGCSWVAYLPGALGWFCQQEGLHSHSVVAPFSRPEVKFIMFSELKIKFYNFCNFLIFFVNLVILVFLNRQNQKKDRKKQIFYFGIGMSKSKTSWNHLDKPLNWCGTPSKTST